MAEPVTVFIAWLASADWRRWRALSAKTLQPRFKDWLEAAQRLEQSQQRQGFTVVRVALDPEQFVAWCRETGVEPGSKARGEFAMVIGSRRQMH